MDSSRRGDDTGSVTPPGWYEDPEAPDLQRWWDGESWSDSEFRARPEPGVLEDYVNSWRDSLPNSPTNYLARQSLVVSAIALASTIGLLVLAIGARGQSLPTVPASLLAIGALVCTFFGVWLVLTSAASIVNARAHHGKRFGEAVVAMVLALLAFGGGAWVIVESFPHGFGVFEDAFLYPRG
jgi:hypothetical protein